MAEVNDITNIRGTNSQVTLIMFRLLPLFDRILQQASEEVDSVTEVVPSSLVFTTCTSRIQYLVL